MIGISSRRFIGRMQSDERNVDNDNPQLGIPHTHPDFVRVRRERFCKLLREAKRVLKFSPEERRAVVELCEMIERNTKTDKNAEN
jgi:hypothetical protein